MTSDSVDQSAKDPHWYAVSTRSRQEKVSAATLEILGVPHLLPLTTELRQWSDRKQAVCLPLFPSYVFVRMNLASEMRLRVLKVPGIVGFVGNRLGPLPIPDAEIEGIRTVFAKGIDCTPHPFLQAGDRVRVIRGALAGIEGTLVRTRAGDQLVLSIEMIQRSLAVSIAARDVEPVADESVADESVEVQQFHIAPVIAAGQSLIQTVRSHA